MPEIRLEVVPKPAKGAGALIHGSDLPFFKGEGQFNYVCGSCGAILADHMEKGQIRGIFFQCPRCSKYNYVA